MNDVLKTIERNPHLTAEQIAMMTGREAEEVKEIIKRAEADRVILGYRTVVNWERAGEDEVAAIIEFRCAPQRGVGFDGIAAQIFRFPEARSVWLVSGTYDLAVMVVAKSMREVSMFVSEKLATIEAVQGTATFFIMKRYKEDGAILEDLDESTGRLAVSP